MLSVDYSIRATLCRHEIKLLNQIMQHELSKISIICDIRLQPEAAGDDVALNLRGPRPDYA